MCAKIRSHRRVSVRSFSVLSFITFTLILIGIFPAASAKDFSFSGTFSTVDCQAPFAFTITQTSTVGVDASGGSLVLLYDSARRFLGSEQPRFFQRMLPAGDYQLLLVSADGVEQSQSWEVTILNVASSSTLPLRRAALATQPSVRKPPVEAGKSRPLAQAPATITRRIGSCGVSHDKYPGDGVLVRCH